MTRRILQILCFSSLIAAVYLLAAPTDPPSSRALSLDQLQGSAGLDRANHVSGTQSCQEKTAALYHDPSVVADSGCTFANSQPGGNTNCIGCGPYDGEPSEMLLAGGANGGPGTAYGATNSCGNQSIGVCTIFLGAVMCGNVVDLNQPCSTVTEYMNQTP